MLFKSLLLRKKDTDKYMLYDRLYKLHEALNTICSTDYPIPISTALGTRMISIATFNGSYCISSASLVYKTMDREILFSVIARENGSTSVTTSALSQHEIDLAILEIENIVDKLCNKELVEA